MLGVILHTEGTDPGGAMVFQANPILCVVVVLAKGILAGFAAGSNGIAQLSGFGESGVVLLREFAVDGQVNRVGILAAKTAANS